jgi:hypothetical protein
VAKPNYSFAKRQREIAKSKKKEAKLLEKLQRKGSKGPAPEDETADSSVIAGTPAAGDDGAGNT